MAVVPRWSRGGPAVIPRRSHGGPKVVSLWCHGGLTLTPRSNAQLSERSELSKPTVVPRSHGGPTVVSEFLLECPIKSDHFFSLSHFS